MLATKVTRASRFWLALGVVLAMALVGVNLRSVFAAPGNVTVRVHDEGAEPGVYGSMDYGAGGYHITDDGRIGFCGWNPVPTVISGWNYTYTPGKYVSGGRAYLVYHAEDIQERLKNQGVTNAYERHYIVQKFVHCGSRDASLYTRDLYADTGYNRTWEQLLSDVARYDLVEDKYMADFRNSKWIWDEVKAWRASSANNASAIENNSVVVALPEGRYPTSGPESGVYTDASGLIYLQPLYLVDKLSGYLQVKKSLAA